MKLSYNEILINLKMNRWAEKMLKKHPHMKTSEVIARVMQKIIIKERVDPRKLEVLETRLRERLEAYDTAYTEYQQEFFLKYC